MTLITVSIIAIIAASLNRIAVIVSRLHADTVDSRMQAEEERIRGMWEQPDVTTPEPEPAQEWPQRQTPTDLQAAYEPVMPQYPWRSWPYEPGLSTRFHLYPAMGVVEPEAPVSIADRRRQAAGPMTEEFQRIVGTEYSTYIFPDGTVGTSLGNPARLERRAA